MLKVLSVECLNASLMCVWGGEIIHSTLTPAHASQSANYYYTEHLDCVLTMCYWVSEMELKEYTEHILQSETFVSCGGNV